MSKKILIASVSFFVFVAVLAGVVFTVVGKEKKKQQAEQIQIQRGKEQQAQEVEQEEIQQELEFQTNQGEELDTSGWQIYQDKDGLFRLKYPLNWDYRITEEGLVEFTEKGRLFENEGLSVYPISVYVGNERRSKKMSTEKYINDIKEGFGVDAVSKTKVNSKNAYLIKTYISYELLIIYDEENDYDLSINATTFGTKELNLELRTIANTMAKSIEFK